MYWIRRNVPFVGSRLAIMRPVALTMSKLMVFFQVVLNLFLWLCWFSIKHGVSFDSPSLELEARLVRSSCLPGFEIQFAWARISCHTWHLFLLLAYDVHQIKILNRILFRQQHFPRSRARSVVGVASSIFFIIMVAPLVSSGFFASLCRFRF